MNNLTNLGYIKELLGRHNFNFSKGLGQNFLVNPSVCPKIAEMGNAQKGFGVIEVGTGIGTLTAELALRADKVVAVEIDQRLLPVLEETLSDFDNIKVINEDIMNVDLNKLISDQGLKNEGFNLLRNNLTGVNFVNNGTVYFTYADGKIEESTWKWIDKTNGKLNTTLDGVNVNVVLRFKKGQPNTAYFVIDANLAGIGGLGVHTLSGQLICTMTD